MFLGLLVIFLSFYVSFATNTKVTFDVYYSVVEQLILVYQIFSKNQGLDYTTNLYNINIIVFILLLSLPGGMLLIAALVSKSNVIYRVIFVMLLLFSSFILFFVFEQNLRILGAYMLALVLFMGFNFFKLTRWVASLLIFAACGFSLKYIYETAALFTYKFLPANYDLLYSVSDLMLNILLTATIVAPFVAAGAVGLVKGESKQKSS